MHSGIVLPLFVTRHTLYVTPPTEDAHFRLQAGPDSPKSRRLSPALSSCRPASTSLSLPPSFSCWSFLSLSAAFSHLSVCHHAVSLTLSLSLPDSLKSLHSIHHNPASRCVRCVNEASGPHGWLFSCQRISISNFWSKRLLSFSEHCQPLGMHFRSRWIFATRLRLHFNKCTLSLQQKPFAQTRPVLTKHRLKKNSWAILFEFFFFSKIEQ